VDRRQGHRRNGRPAGIWGVQLAIAVLATVFTLVVSNVGATVLLVPLAANVAVGVGADPRSSA
jgi:di/tricarboxylate transporter